MEFKNNNNIVNLSNSVLKNFDVPTFHDTIPEIDNLLKGHKKVVVMLFDGMGTAIREKHKDSCPFIRSGKVHTIESTFPPTTVAATNAFLTGKYPIETGWMSWTQYFDYYKRNINVFTNMDPQTGEIIRPQKDGHILSDICPITKLFELINETRKADIATCLGFGKIVTKGLLKDFRNRYRIHQAVKNKDESFVYYYEQNPDHLIHEFGVNSKKVSKKIKSIDKFVKKVVKKDPDTVFVVIADHGLIDLNYLYIDEHEDLMSTLVEDKPISMEKRCPTFFVKEDKKNEFKELFVKYFGEHFELFTKEEVLQKHIYGEGTPHPETKQFIGDFVAISKDNSALVRKEDDCVNFMVASHAGGTDNERNIDVSVFNA